VLSSTDILALTETSLNNAETVAADGYKCITQFKRQDVTAGELAMYGKNNTTTVAAPHLLVKLDEQNMTKMSFKLAASESCADIRAAKWLVNGQRVLVATVYDSPNTSRDDLKSLRFSNLVGYSLMCAKC
jgi:hypothetical protein